MQRGGVQDGLVTCSVRKATTSSKTLTVKSRGQESPRSARRRTGLLLNRPSSTLNGQHQQRDQSGGAGDVPGVPGPCMLESRDRHFSSCWCSAVLTRPPRHDAICAVIADEPRGQAGCLWSHPTACSPRRIAAVLATLASTHVAAATVAVRQQDLAGSPVRGVDEAAKRWRCRCREPRCPSTLDVARPPSLIGHELPVDATLAVVVSKLASSATPTSQPSARGGPATLMSPPRLT